MLVDTNVILDIVEDDPDWADWSQARLEALSVSRTLVINPVIYAELSIGYRRIEDLERMLTTVGLSIEALPREALFMAGKVYRRYRAKGGAKAGVLPDFFIGAHAAVTGMSLVTRDPRRYRTYFPSVALITPID